MSPWNGPRRPERPEPPAEPERLLLEAVLGEGVCRAAARRRLEADPRSLRELRAFETRLREARAELASVPGWNSGREQALVERILAHTTRAQPAARRRPWWLSLGAAAVLLCAGALALWLAERGTAPELETRLAALPGHDWLPASRAPQVPSDPSWFAAAREELTTTASASGRGARVSAADAPLEVRLLEARAKGLREQRWAPWVRELSPAELDALSLALWCEVQLDRYVLSGARPPAWKHVVQLLHATLERPETPRESSKLLAHALDRARDYGLTGDATSDITVARLDPPGPLWTGAWFDDLDAAGREAGIADSGTWRAWVDWRGR